LMADVAVGFLVIPNVIALFLLRKEFVNEYYRFRNRPAGIKDLDIEKKRERSA
ncbi:hypothetical protein, partial [Klebsiella pneumoniae]|uniref:hypothetical protein n=1 Tax=Klebsiella pneumoniae complex TaxID=3390273 RepID=UPI001D6387F5|nr:sodium:alanine symporter family protein [Klebsiella variicola]